MGALGSVPRKCSVCITHGGRGSECTCPASTCPIMRRHNVVATMVSSVVGFINPGSLGDRLPRQGSAQENSMLFMGRPKSLKHNGPEGQSGRRPEGLPKRTSTRSSTCSAHLSDRNTGALASDTSRLRAVSPIGRPGPKRCFLLRPRVSDQRLRRKPTCRSSPASATRTDWGHLTGDARSEGTRGEQKRQRTSQTMILGPYPVRLREQCSTTTLTQIVL